MIGSKKYFIDTAPYIYYLDKNKLLYDKAKAFFKETYEADAELVTSAVTVEEYLVYPYKNDDKEAIDRFFEFIGDTETSVIHINEDIAARAARIRAKYTSFKAMDSLQLAVAVEEGCDVFLTNDKRLKKFEGVEVITVEELADPEK